MKKFLLDLLKNPVVSGSLVMVVGSNITNFINYIYHFLMGRLLGPVQYGELVALFSLIGLLSMVPGSFGLTIIKFVSSSRDHLESEGYIKWFRYISQFIGVSLFIVVLIFSPLISGFLKIEHVMLVMMSGLIFCFSVPTFVNRSILQGQVKFGRHVMSVLSENFVKLVAGGILVYFGYQIFGAFIGYVAATIVGWYATLLFLRSKGKSEDGNSRIDIKKVFNYSGPVLVYSIAMTSLINTDILLVKHYFSAYDAGLYAALSNLGKIIFFSTGPIVAVMFPLISKKNSQGKPVRDVLWYSLLLTSLVIFILLFIYWMWPELTITLLYGTLYKEASGLLILFGIFIGLLTISSLMINYHLSLSHTKVVIIPFLAAILQIIGILLHHHNLQEAIVVSIIVTALLLIFLLIFSKKQNIRFTNDFG